MDSLKFIEQATDHSFQFDAQVCGEEIALTELQLALVGGGIGDVQHG